MLSGTVQVELNEADRCTGMVDSVVPFPDAPSFELRLAGECDTTVEAAPTGLPPIMVAVEWCEECCFELVDTSDDEEE